MTINKDQYRDVLLASTKLRRTDKVLALNICQRTDENGRGCYATTRTMSAWIDGAKNTTKSALVRLCEHGFLVARAAAEDPDVPKARGYVWDILLPPHEGSEIDPSDRPARGQKLTLRECEGSEIDPSQKMFESVEKNRQSPKRQNLRGQFLTPSRSTTTSTISDGMGSGGATSRVSEATGSATHPTTDPVERLQREIVTALEGVDVYFPSPEEQVRHAVKQNRKHVRLILQKIGSLETAIDYVQLRGTEWCERVKMGQKYNAPVILGFLAGDASGGWTMPDNPAQWIKKKIERQVKEQFAGTHTWELREGWLEEWSQRNAQEREQLAAESQAALVPAAVELVREPVALGAVVAALVPAVASAARRTPQAAEEPQKATPAAATPNGASVAEQACEAIAKLAQTYGEINPSQAEYRDGKEGVAAAAGLWALVQAGRAFRVEGERRVVMMAGPEVLTDWMRREIRQWVEIPAATRDVEIVWGDAPRAAAPAPTPPPSMAPLVEEERSAIVRKPSAPPVETREVPTWWPQLIARLKANGARHAASRSSDAAATSKRLELIADTLQTARRAMWSGGVLTIEVDELGALAQASAIACAAIGWAVALELDLASEAEVVFVDLSQGEEVWA